MTIIFVEYNLTKLKTKPLTANRSRALKSLMSNSRIYLRKLSSKRNKKQRIWNFSLKKLKKMEKGPDGSVEALKLGVFNSES
jgi:hypothetical protein